MAEGREPGVPPGAAQTPPGSPAGWYRDPSGQPGHRWWDGRSWTEFTASATAAPAQLSTTSELAIASLVIGLTLVGGPIAFVLGLVARGRIRRSGGAVTGRGIALAGIVLGILGSLAIAGVVVLALTGAFGEEENAESFAGEEREVAAVIDEFEAASDDEQLDYLCGEIFTTRFEGLIEQGTGMSCPAYFAVEAEGATYQLPIEIEALELTGTTATVRADEGGEKLTFALVDEGDRWRVDDIR